MGVFCHRVSLKTRANITYSEASSWAEVASKNFAFALLSSFLVLRLCALFLSPTPPHPFPTHVCSSISEGVILCCAWR